MMKLPAATGLLALLLLGSCVPNSRADDAAVSPPLAPEAASTARPTASPAANPAAPGTATNSPAAARFTNYFDKQRAWSHMRAQVGFGFRVPGTPAAANCRKYLVDHLRQYCDSVEEQLFTVDQARGKLRMYNIFARINPQEPRRILLLAHWDTRPSADLNPPGKRNQPIDGANDGASGVAVLLELARVFHEKRPSVGIDILLTDGEDYGPGMSMMFLGAKHFAAQLGPAEVVSYNYGILLDMVGDTSLDIHPEMHSESPAGRVYQAAVEVSRGLGYNNFKQTGAYQIYDDHLPLIEKGIRVYNFIDFNYPHWHTTEDTLDKCSPDSLEAVGRTVENLIYKFPAIYGPDEPLRPGRIPGAWR